MTSFPSLAIWLVPTLVLVAIGMMVSLDRLFEKQARQELKSIRHALRKLQAERIGLELTTQSFGESDPEPYRSQAADLQERLVSVRVATEDFEKRLIRLNERAAVLKHKRRLFIFGQPYSWRKLGNEAASLESEMRSLKPALEIAAELGHELQRLPWSTAQEARTLLSRQRAVTRRMQALRDGGLYGDTFEQTTALELELHTSLSQIPVAFLECTEAELVLVDPRQDTAMVHGLVRENSARLADLSHRVAEWEAAFQSAQEKVDAMLLSLDELRNVMTHLPPGLDSSSEKTFLRQLDTVGETLRASATRLEVESMPLVAKEADRIRQASQEKCQEIESITRELASLEMLLEELGNGFRDLSLQLAALSARNVHPVKWEHSLEALAELDRQTDALLEIKTARTPVKVGEDFKTAAVILADQKEIEQAIQEVALAHSELTALLQSPDISGLSAWIKTSRSLIEQAQKFGHENWGRLSDFSSLTSDIDLLADEAGGLLSADPAEPVSELQVGERLAEVRRIAAMHQRLRVGVEKIASRLANLKLTEQHAVEQIEEIQNSLSQFRLIVNSNPFLIGIALKEIDRLLHKAYDLKQDLAEKGRGSVDKKALQVESLHASAIEAANRWQEELEKGIQALLKELSGRLAELDQIAQLEDPSVAEVRRLLSSREAPSGGQTRTRRHEKVTESTKDRPKDQAVDNLGDRTQLMDLILGFQRSSEEWQEITIAKKSLEEVLPLLETYHEASNLRDQARQQIAETEGWSAKKRSWPPAAVGHETERQELEHLEAEWAALRKRSAKAIAVVGLYSSLASRYQNLAEKVSQSAGQRRKQQTGVEELDNQIAEQAGQWENLMNEHNDNLDASQEIARFLSDLDDSLQEIENGYLREELEYEDVLYRMNAVLRRARYFQVALDDDHALDVNGRVLRRQ